MTRPTFTKIAQMTSSYFWPLVYSRCTDEEVTYLKHTPVARRNLDRRLFMALAETLLSPDQIQAVRGLELEDPQTDIHTGQSTETPFSKPIP